MTKRLLSLLVSCCGIASAAERENASVSAQNTVRAEVQVISVSQARGLQIVPLLRQPERFSGGAERIQAMLKSGEAQLIDHLQTETLSGQKAVADSVEEVPYHGDPMALSGVGSPTFADKTLAYEINSRREGEFPGERARLERLNARVMERITKRLRQSSYSLNLSTPTPYERRYVGLMFAFEPRVEEDGAIETTAIMQHIRQTGQCTPLRPGDEPQPRFTTSKMEANVRTRSGQLTLLGTELQPGVSPRVLLYLMRLVVTRPKPTP